MTKYINGNDFLNKIYKDLHLSEEVKHVSNPSDSQPEKIGKFINRLDRVHSKANTEVRKDRIKKLYHNKYVIKRENMQGLPIEAQNKVIEAQTRKLDEWIDYLTDENTRYPMWAKYWAFQGMLKIGTYNETTESYGKRSDKTTSPFIDVNPEVLNKCIDLVIQSVNGKEIDDENLKRLIDSGNFQKLYTLLYAKDKKKKLELSGFDGKWIKYGIGSEEEAKKLFDSLQGYSTGWCTAGSFSTAKDQVCGGGGYPGGDFYVYYTKDEKGEYKVPRIAIRMSGRRKIGEIRGVDESQNLEEGFESIVESKLNDMTFLSDESKDKNMEKVFNAKELTRLNKKVNNNERLTHDEELYLFTKSIKNFGWEEDPRIKKIRNKSKITYRDIMLNIFNESRSGIALQYASEELKNDREVVIEAVKQCGEALEYASERLQNDREVVFTAIRQNGCSLQYASDKLKNDRATVIEAIKKSGSRALKYASNKLKNDKIIKLYAKRIAIRFIKKYGGWELCQVFEEFRNDKELVIEAVRRDGSALKYASDKLQNDKQIVLAAVRRDGSALKYASDKLQNDKQIVLAAVRQDGRALRYASEKLRNDKQTVLAAVRQIGRALQYASKELQGDKELVLEAVRQDGYALRFVSEKLRNDREVALAAVRQDGTALEYVSEELRNDREVVLEAVRQNEYALKYASEEVKKYISTGVITPNDGIDYGVDDDYTL